MGEIARVLKTRGRFRLPDDAWTAHAAALCPRADRMLKFGYFYLDDLKERLYRFNFSVVKEERSNINYIFLAAKSGSDNCRGSMTHDVDRKRAVMIRPN